jgi:CheY-like chemotaxis protein
VASAAAAAPAVPAAPAAPAAADEPVTPKKTIGAYMGELAARKNEALALGGAPATAKADSAPPSTSGTPNGVSSGNGGGTPNDTNQAKLTQHSSASPGPAVSTSKPSPPVTTSETIKRSTLPPVIAFDKNEPSSLPAHAKKILHSRRVPTNNVLSVDDIPVNQKLLRMQLKRLGFKIDTAANGKEAIDAVVKGDYDFVFMDLDMPVMDGLTATAAIRKLEANTDKHVPIIAMTSYDRDVDRQASMKSGMDDYLVKGATQKQLADVVVKFSPRIAAAGEEGAQQGLKVEDVILAVDLNGLRKNLGKEELEEVSRLFGSSISTFVDCMRLAIDERSSDAFGHFAHCIKGPAAAMGLTGMTAIISDMIRASEAEDWLHVGYQYLNLRTNFTAVLTKLKTLCESEPNSNGLVNEVRA